MDHQKTNLEDADIAPLSSNSDDMLPDLVVHARELGRANLCLDKILKLCGKRLQFAYNQTEHGQKVCLYK